MLVVPVSVAENVGVCPETGLLEISFSVMVTVEVATPSAMTGVVPVIDELAATAAAEVNTTVPPIFETGVKRERVFVSAVVELRVQVEIPERFVTEQSP